MKKIISIFMLCSMIFCLAACGSNESTGQSQSVDAGSLVPSITEKPEETESQSEANDETPSESSEPEESTSNALVVYFSATGNTKSVAEALAELQNADIYEIVPEEPYTDADLNYNDRSSRSTVEQNDENARPAISGGTQNIQNYDVIYVGYPIWWGDMPRILYTFFDTYDLSGKTIAPFCTSGGSGLSGTPRTITALEPDATVADGLHIGDSSLDSAGSSIEEWLSSIGL